MKKLFLLCISILLLTTGCFKESNEDLIKKYEDTLEKSKSYKLTATMEISSDTEVFKYAVESNYLEDDFYKVVLVNETNNQEQVILRNESGVYVISPSLNKSFKFDSVWPDNSSQSYLLHSILKDIKDDSDNKLKETDSGYEIKATVNYPNNTNLKYEKIYFDKNMKILGVEVFDEDDEIYIKVEFLDVDYKANLKEKDFALENYVDQNQKKEDEKKQEENEETDKNDVENEDSKNVCDECEDEECKKSCATTSSSLDNILYPLYIPSNTSLSSSESITTDNSDRVILTFAGDKNFVLIEEVSPVYSEFETIPITGNPLLLNDTIAAISSNSIYFTKNGIDYYIVSNDLTSSEMVNVANSVGSVQSVLSTK